MGRRQDVVVRDDGATAQARVAVANVREKQRLVRELACRCLIATHDATRWPGVAQVLHVRRQTPPVVVELIDRLHLRPVDLDPLRCSERADGQQASNDKRTGDLHGSTVFLRTANFSVWLAKFHRWAFILCQKPLAHGKITVASLFRYGTSQEISRR
uniref:Uncharacterized protein n=1 Tax=Anopheles atroparvus TaxID=41427 RepID=A0AAG5DET9_ANOAO